MVRGVRGITRCAYKYVCLVVNKDGKVDHFHESENLQAIMKAIRTDTEHKFKIPHGNKVRAIMLEQGDCNIIDPFTDNLYKISINRWAV